jgi:hypothetical protein
MNVAQIRLIYQNNWDLHFKNPFYESVSQFLFVHEFGINRFHLKLVGAPVNIRAVKLKPLMRACKF